MIDYPDSPQSRMSRSWDCGRAMTAAVLLMHGRRVPRLFPATSLDGTHPRSIESVLRASGLRVQSGEMELADLSHHTVGMRRPVIALVRHAGFGHYVGVRGVDRRRVWLYCPDRGNVYQSRAEFLANWWDADGDVRNHQLGIVSWADV